MLCSWHAVEDGPEIMQANLGIRAKGELGVAVSGKLHGLFDIGTGIKAKHGGDDTKVINLIKSIENTAEEESGDPFLVAMAERAQQVKDDYEERQKSTREALDDLFAEIKKNEERKRRQAEKGYDSVRFFVFTALEAANVPSPDKVSEKIARAFVDFPSWRESEADLREVRNKATFAVYAEVDDVDAVPAIVDGLSRLISGDGAGG